VTALTSDQVRHIAKLARLTLTKEEEERYAGQLTSILQYVDMLQEVETKNVEPTAQVTGLTNSFRPDVVDQNGPSRDALLGTSPLPIIDHQIQTPSAHG